MEKVIRLLFSTKVSTACCYVGFMFCLIQDISLVKQYLSKQWSKILAGRISLPDFIFAKEVRLGTYSSKVECLHPSSLSFVGRVYYLLQQ